MRVGEQVTDLRGRSGTVVRVWDARGYCESPAVELVDFEAVDVDMGAYWGTCVWVYANELTEDAR